MAVKNAINIYGTDYDLADGVNLVSSIETNKNAIYNHPKGSYFLYNGLIYKAIDNIEVDDEIHPGNAGNCQRAYIGDTLFDIFGKSLSFSINQGGIDGLGYLYPNASLCTTEMIKYTEPLLIKIQPYLKFIILKYDEQQRFYQSSLTEEYIEEEETPFFYDENKYFRIMYGWKDPQSHLPRLDAEINHLTLYPLTHLIFGHVAADGKMVQKITVENNEKIQNLQNNIQNIENKILSNVIINFKSGQIIEGVESNIFSNQYPYAISDYILYTGQTIINNLEDNFTIKYRIIKYNDNFSYNNTSNWITEKNFTFNYDIGQYYRIECTIDENVDFDGTEIDDFSITIYTDPTLTVYGSPADAKAVGNKIENTIDIINKTQNIIAPNYTNLILPISIGTYCIKENKIYRAKINITNEGWNSENWDEIQISSIIPKIDSTLTIENSAADAQAVGNALNDINNKLSLILELLQAAVYTSDKSQQITALTTALNPNP